MVREAYDVCVFGAGPAGAATAVRLAALGLAAIVLDRPPRTKLWGGESFSGAIRRPLQVLGLWDAFSRAGHVTSHEQRTAWGGDPWVQDAIFYPHGSRWHVDRARFDADLREGVRSRGIPTGVYRSLDELSKNGTQWRMRLDGGTEISCRYLVDATGRSRAIARRFGARSRVYDRLVGLTAQLPRNQAFDHTMVIETTAHGWWYAAPVPQGHVLNFFTDADLAPRHLVRTLRTVVANSTFTPAEIGQGWLPVGDACAAHDPLCGWGVYRAMSNGILAAEAIHSYLNRADAGPLEEYRLHVRNQFETYLDGLTRHYSYERRWTAFPFWERRVTPVAFVD